MDGNYDGLEPPSIQSTFRVRVASTEFSENEFLPRLNCTSVIVSGSRDLLEFTQSNPTFSNCSTYSGTISTFSTCSPTFSGSNPTFSSSPSEYTNPDYLISNSDYSSSEIQEYISSSIEDYTSPNNSGGIEDYVSPNSSGIQDFNSPNSTGITDYTSTGATEYSFQPCTDSLENIKVRFLNRFTVCFVPIFLLIILRTTFENNLNYVLNFKFDRPGGMWITTHRFSRSEVYWILTNKQTNEQTSNIYISIYMQNF